MIKAVLWDNDGTLLESEELYRVKMKELVKKYGIDLEQSVVDKHGALALKDYLQALIHHYGIKVTVEEMRKTYSETFKKKIPPLTPFAVDVLKALAPKYKMALVSNATREWLEYILDHYNLRPYFKTSVAIDDVLEGKPSPEPYLKALEKLDVFPNEAIAIEDSTVGFHAVKDAGLRLIARKSQYNTGQEFHLADYVVEDLREIPKIITNLNKN